MLSTFHSPPDHNNGTAAVFKFGLITSFCFLLLSIYNPSIIKFFEYRVYDVMHEYLDDRGLPRPVIVDIDEKSLNEIGQWPWPRYQMATLLDKICEAGPGAVGIDVIFAEPDRTSIGAVSTELFLRSGIKLPLLSIPELLHDNDLTLSHSLRKGPFIMAYKLLSKCYKPEKTSVNASVPGVVPLKIFIASKNEKTPGFRKFHRWESIVAPVPVLAAAIENSGFINVMSDEDGIIRQIPMIAKYGKHFLPSLSLACVMEIMGAQRLTLYVNPSGTLDSIRIKDTVIPVMADGSMLLNYRKGNDKFDAISASDILRDRIDRSRLNKKIIFIGTSASGLGDEHATPVNRVFAGVKIHATAADNILNKNFISRPPWGRAVTFFVTAAVGMISTVVLMKMTPVLCTFFLIILGGGLCYSEFLMLSRAHAAVSFFYPFLTLMANFSFLSLIRFRIGEKNVFERTREMAAAQNLTIIGITSLAATRDTETGLHIRRTAIFLKILAKHLSQSPRFADQLDDYTIELLYKSAPMHDIGKVGVPDAILLKPGRLTDEEFAEIKKHTDYGWEAINEAEQESGIDSGSSFLKIAKELILSHHEKWDGTGYNQGLKGVEIPLSARLMALVDVYDALTSKRGYKNAFSHETAKKIILEGRGTHFDPDVVDAFIEVAAEFKALALKMSD